MSVAGLLVVRMLFSVVFCKFFVDWPPLTGWMLVFDIFCGLHESFVASVTESASAVPVRVRDRCVR
jgi:hypothetical protein